MRLFGASHRITASLALALAGAAAVGVTAGCQPNGTKPETPTTKTPAPAMTPASGPTMQGTPPPTTVPATPAAAAPAPMLKAADLTHVVSADSPYFASMPLGEVAPTGTFKSGTKVLVMVPGSKYSKVMTEGGVTAYTGTKSLEPIGKK